MKRFPAALVFLCLLSVEALFCPSALLAGQPPSLEGLRVSTITVSGCRTSPDEIMEQIALKAGGPWTSGAEAQSRRDLHEMGVFKSVSLNSRYDPATGGVAVDIKASDGWYLIPLPFVTGGSDGGGFSLTLVSGNVLRRAETMFARLKTGSGETSGLLGFHKGNWFVSAKAGESSQNEKRYADGAYSVAGTNAAESHAASVSDSYTRKSAFSSFTVARRFGDDYRHRLGLDYSQSKYSFSDSTSLLPSEPGSHNALGLSYSYTLKTNGGANLSGGGLGVLFGMGLSDLEERLKPLPATASTNEFSARAGKSGAFVGSDYDYTTLNLNWNGVWEFRHHDRLQFSAAGVKGWGLPFTQLAVSSGGGFMRGTYLRQWRGDSAFGATAAYSWFLSRSRRGILTAEPFVEHSWVLDGALCHSQAGAGMAFYYRFWRFPMPIGISVTRSFMDRDFAFAAAAGFGFGRQ